MSSGFSFSPLTLDVAEVVEQKAFNFRLPGDRNLTTSLILDEEVQRWRYVFIFHSI